MSPTPPTVLRRAVYLRGLAAVHLVAVASLWPQLAGLVGERGILPAHRHLERLWEALGIEAVWKVPTLLWALPGDAGLNAVCALWAALAALLLAGATLEGPLLLGLWACSLSISVAGQLWLGFQWDALLVEATFAAMLVARWRPGQHDAPRYGWIVQHWLLFRLMFFGGLVKLTSGDPTWADGSALTFHYLTQPLPNPVSWFAHQLPPWVHAVSVLGALGIELLLPLAIPLGVWGRRAAFTGFVLLMGLLFISGNFGWFQILTVVLCFTLLDDADLKRVVPERAWPRTPHGTSWPVLAPLAVALAVLSMLRVPDLPALPGPAQAIVRSTYPYRIVNRYGLFAVMTAERREVVFEGSLDGETWQPYALPAKPGDPMRRPPQVAPHMPRLDWQLWFAALGDCRQNAWVLAVQRHLVDGNPTVLGLFADDPFGGEPPRYVRTMLYDYRFAAPGSEAWWERDLLGPYCPEMERPE